MADGMTPEERALIDAAMAEGRVTICPPRKSSFGYMRHRMTGKLVWVNEIEIARRGKSRAGLRGDWIDAADLAPIEEEIEAAAPEKKEDARLTIRRRHVLGLHKSGMIPAEIGKRLQVDGRTVRADLEVLGLKPNTTGYVARRRAARLARQERVMTLKRRNISDKDIAESLGVTPTTIHNDVRELRERGAL